VKLRARISWRPCLILVVEIEVGKRPEWVDS